MPATWSLWFCIGEQYLSNPFGVHVCPRFVIGYVLGRYIHEDRLQKLTSLVSAQMSEPPSLVEPTTIQIEKYVGVLNSNKRL